jgi:VanZ family protein
MIWASIIFATSTTVIHSRAFVATVSSHLPVDHAERAFSTFWEGWWWVFVKGYHALEFAILFLLLRVWLRAAASKRAELVSAILSVAFAASDEFHQTFVPGRGGRFTDVLIDSGGIAAAWLVVAGYRAIRHRNSDRA